MSGFEQVEGSKGKILISDALSEQSAEQMSGRGSVGHDLASRVSASAADADRLLNAPGRFELVADGVTPQMQQDVQRGIHALKSDALSGEAFSPDSIKTFQQIFQSEADVHGATAQSVMGGLNAVGAAINQAVSPELSQIPGRRPEPIGMAAMQNPDGSVSYYMMLSKDDAALQKNRADLITGTSSPTIIKLGPFVPGQKP